MRNNKFFWALPLALSVLNGCASYRNADSTLAQATLPELEFDAALGAERFYNENAPLSHWWQQLDDPQLSQLIEQALAANHDIRIAFANINASRALLRRSRLDYWPSVTSGLSATRERAGGDLNPNREISESFSAGLNASWEMDVFGRVRHQVKLSRAQLAASQADYRGVQVSIVADVASTYMQLQTLQALISIAERSVDIQQSYVGLVEGMREVGRSSDFDLKRAQAQLKLTVAQLPSLELRYINTLNRLSILTAKETGELRSQLEIQGVLPSIPASIAVGNAQDLLQNRPDVLRAEQRLQGAIAEYNLRVADLYPEFSLTGQFGYLSTEWSNLGEQSSETFRFTPSIRWAALDLSRVKSLIAAADARAEACLAEFEKTVLVAIRETDNAIAGFNFEEKRRQNLHQASIASASAAKQARLTYEKGRGDLRDVLDAEWVRLNSAQQLVQSEAAIVQHLVDIYKNLGGGWLIAPEMKVNNFASN